MKAAPLFITICMLVSLATTSWATTYTEAEGRAAWTRLQRQPITEATFRQACDLIQDIGQANLALAYDLLAQCVSVVGKSGNRRWTHILLIN